MASKTRIWDSVFFAWIAWCLAAYGSGRLAPSVAAYLASTPAAVIAAVVGVLLGWQAWAQHGPGEGQRRWLPLRAWPIRSWAGIVAGVLWLGLEALNARDGRVGGVFGMYIVLALLVGFVPRSLTTNHAAAAPEPP